MSGSLRVAVVDDEVSVRRALGRLLAASNLAVETFVSGQEFLDSLADHRPDCLILDLHMPGLTGLGVQRELACAGIRLPIVIITAYDGPELRAQCLAAGAAEYLLKPLDDQTLLEAIARAVAKPSSHDVNRRDAPETNAD
jgi:FixJ family two-component response regulator